jgi:carbon-monoxide dehydrogenase medium subunit
MFPDGFTYERAGSVDEALDLLAEHADADTELLAGGHSLLPTMKTRLASPDVVVDIGRIDELRGVETDRDANTTTIGALTTYATVESADSLLDGCPAVAEAAGEIGDRQVRNAGTVGGNLAHADPAADLPASVLAADATLHVAGPDGSRAVPAGEFFRGTFQTDLDDGELLTRVEIPTDGANTTSTYVKRPHPGSGYATVGVAAAVRTDGEGVASARVAVTGATDHAVRLGAVEEALVGEPLSEDAVDAAAARATDDLDGATLLDDASASSEFRARLLEEYTGRALRRVAGSG